MDRCQWQRSIQTNEQVSTGLYGTGAVLGQFSLPQVAESITTLMRIIMRYSAEATQACGDIGNGEVEDFTVVLHPTIASDELPDICSSETPYTGNSITSRQTICLPDNGVNYVSIAGSDSVDSLAITTGHGSGDLSLYANNGNWPATNGSDSSSTQVGNAECIVINNPSQFWTYVTVSGTKSNASLVVDLGASSCRETSDTTDPVDPIDPVDPPSNGNDGYPFDSVHVKFSGFSLTMPH